MKAALWERSTLKLERFILSKIFYDLCLYNLFSIFFFQRDAGDAEVKRKTETAKDDLSSNEHEWNPLCLFEKLNNVALGVIQCVPM